MHDFSFLSLNLIIFKNMMLTYWKPCLAKVSSEDETTHIQPGKVDGLSVIPAGVVDLPSFCSWISFCPRKLDRLQDSREQKMVYLSADLSVMRQANLMSSQTLYPCLLAWKVLVSGLRNKAYQILFVFRSPNYTNTYFTDFYRVLQELSTSAALPLIQLPAYNLGKHWTSSSKYLGPCLLWGRRGVEFLDSGSALANPGCCNHLW